MYNLFIFSVALTTAWFSLVSLGGIYIIILCHTVWGLPAIIVTCRHLTLRVSLMWDCRSPLCDIQSLSHATLWLDLLYHSVGLMSQCGSPLCHTVCLLLVTLWVFFMSQCMSPSCDIVNLLSCPIVGLVSVNLSSLSPVWSRRDPNPYLWCYRNHFLWSSVPYLHINWCEIL